MKDSIIGKIIVAVVTSLVLQAMGTCATTVITTVEAAREARADEEHAQQLQALIEAQDSYAELRTTTVTCTTSATRIAPPGAATVTAINTSATAVFIGGSDVDGSTAGTTGVSVCSSGCNYSIKIPYDVKESFCIVASGSQALEIVYAVR